MFWYNYKTNEKSHNGRKSSVSCNYQDHLIDSISIESEISNSISDSRELSYKCIPLKKSWWIPKRILDFFGSLIGLVVLAPVILFAMLVVRVTSNGPIFFAHIRVGQHGKIFKCIKFRTMVIGAEAFGSITTVNDSRITLAGRILRRYKLDELPQLLNVLGGKMSLVGPRPDVSGYVDHIQGDARQVLELLPGITGPATLLFRNEEYLLAKVTRQNAFNDEVIYPEKIRINQEYLKTASFLRDIGYILATIMPFVTKLIGLDSCLGLNYETFSKRMEKEASRY